MTADSPSARWLGVGRSHAPDGAVAAATAATAAVAGREVALLIVGCSARYDAAQVAAGLREAVGPGTPMIGGTTGGEVHAASFEAQGVAVVALGGSGLTVATAAATIDRSAPQQAGQLVGVACAAVSESRSRVMLLFSDVQAGDQQEVLRGVYRMSGAGVPLVGGACGRPLGGGDAWQLHDGRVLSGALVGAAVGSAGRFGVGIGHGWRPVGEPMLVTSSTGAVIRELDERPALEVYLSRLSELPTAVPVPAATDLGDTDGAEAFAAVARMHPLGLHRRSGALVRSVIAAEPESGALVCAAGVPAGALLWPMSGEVTATLDGLDHACAEAVSGLGGKPPAGLLTFDCVARREILGPAGVAEEARRLQAAVVGRPVAGVFTFGEIARTRGLSGFHNKTVAALAVS